MKTKISSFVYQQYRNIVTIQYFALRLYIMFLHLTHCFAFIHFTLETHLF